MFNQAHTALHRIISTVFIVASLLTYSSCMNEAYADDAAWYPPIIISPPDLVPYNNINLPFDGNFGEDASIGNHTILNIYDGGYVGEDFTSNAGSIVNLYHGGHIDEEYDANAGSTLNIYGGTIGEDFESNGAKVNLHGTGFSLGDRPLFFINNYYEDVITRPFLRYLFPRPIKIKEHEYDSLHGYLSDGSRFVFDDYFDEINYNDGMDLWVYFSFRLFLPGDFNRDGYVDASDYTVWRSNYGAAAGTLSNDMYETSIGMDQYKLWASNYGNSIESMVQINTSAFAVGIPEPSTLVISLLGLSFSLTRRKS